MKAAIAARLFGSLLLCACSAGDPPNVLLVTVDTLRADHLSSYGFPLRTSPNIDALAASGVLFERAVAAAPSTAPSHATIMTGLYTRQHSIGYSNGGARLVGAATLAERFRDAGYATGAFVGNVVLKRSIGLDRGFDVYDDELPSAEANRPFIFERIAAETTARAVAWLAARGGPFFLWVHYQDPHGPYLPPPAYVGRFEPRAERDEPALPRLDRNVGIGGIPAYQALEGVTTASAYRARYADEIFYADESIGVLLEAVGPAIVLLTADHGELLGENDRYFMHGLTSLPPEAHVPFVLRAPGLPVSRRTDVVSHVDVYPTLLELAGLATPDTSGVALGPILRGERPFPERSVYCDAGREISAYADGSFVRVWPADDAWGRRPVPAQRSWARHPWEPGSLGPGEPVPEGDRAGLERYLTSAVSLAPAGAPSPEDVERLRALGYAD